MRVHAVERVLPRHRNASIAQALKRAGLRDAEIGTHAGLADTSLALAVDPRLVRSASSHRHTDARGRADGVYGDPRRASAELGTVGVDAIVRATVAAIRQAVARR